MPPGSLANARAAAVAQPVDVDDVERRRAAREGDRVSRSRAARRASRTTMSATSVGVRADAHARAPRAPRALAGGGAVRAGDDRAGVAHRLAGRRREAGDVGDDGLGDVLGDVAAAAPPRRRRRSRPPSRSARSRGRPRSSAITSMKLEPGTGSPPMPTIDGVAEARAARARCRSGRSACPSARRRRRCPRGRTRAGMIPTFALPGESTPGQLGPISVTPGVRRRWV